MTLLDKLILGQVYLYLERGLDEAESHLNPIIYDLKTQAKLRVINQPFSKEEQTKLKELGDNPDFKELMQRKVSFIIFGLHLIRLYVEDIPKSKRPHLGISDKKLKMGHRIYTVDMLKLKQRDKAKYEDTKHIIDDSVEIAEGFYKYAKEIA